MLTKNWKPDAGSYDVTFDLPAELEIEQAAVVGDFNGWDESADPMQPDGDGRWTATISLEPGNYRFRYHLGGGEWENDWSADDYVPNDHGGSDSVVQVPEAPSEPPPAKRAAKKSAGKKSPAKKSAAKKSAPKKSAAKKAPAKKATARKPSTE